MSFEPRFSITAAIANSLMRVEGVRQAVEDLPITASVLAVLRETARLFSTHYSTMIEGNRLTQDEVAGVVARHQHFPGRDRDEKEVLAYYAALAHLEEIARSAAPISEEHIQILHGLTMADGRGKVRPTPYRDGQNVIRDSRSGGIVYMPPEAKDVAPLMNELVLWMNRPDAMILPCPIRASIAHYQFATIHPYYDGNGRTARLLTTLILHLGGYDLKRLYSLEEYYARNLGAYYEALSIGPSHNYYEGRAEADITKWIEYFCGGVAESFESVRRRAQEAARSGAPDHSAALRRLDPRQRRALLLFRESDFITSRDVEVAFGIAQRTARDLLGAWVRDGFLTVADATKKARKYGLGDDFAGLLE